MKKTLSQKYPDGKIPDETLLLFRHEAIVSKVKKKHIQLQLSTRFHYFIDESEKNKIVKFDDPENKYNCMIYTYIEEPIFNNNFIFDSLYDMFSSSTVTQDDLIMFYIYYDYVKKKYGMKCTKVLNKDEFGSKHFNLMEACPPNHYFVSAGEMKRLNNNALVSFNLMSGTFTKLTLDVLEFMFQLGEYKNEEEFRMLAGYDEMSYSEFLYYWERQPDGFADVKDTDYNKYKILIENYRKFFDDNEFGNYTRKHLQELNPFYYFCGDDEPFTLNIKTPFSNYRLNIQNDVSPYYILVSDEYVDYMEVLFELVCTILFVFKHLDNMELTYEDVNCIVSPIENQVQTRAGITMQQIENTNNVPNMSPERGGVSVRVYPQLHDLNTVKSIFKKYRMSNFSSNPTVDKEPRQTKLFDILGIENKSYNIYYDRKTIVLNIENITYMGNSIVYMGRIQNKKVIVKFVSCYKKFASRFIAIQNAGFSLPKIRDEVYFYESEVYRFILPGTAFVCTVIPYFGESVEKLPYEKRTALYGKFKRQYVEQFIRYGFRGVFTYSGIKYKIAYRDVKPENVTIDDNEDFNLIDIDAHSYSLWYGPGTDNVKSVLFSIAALFYWFKHNKYPFRDGDSDEVKIQWANRLEDSEIKEMLTRIYKFNSNITSTEQIQSIRDLFGLKLISRRTVK